MNFEQKYIVNSELDYLFDTVNARNILGFIRDIGLDVINSMALP